MKVLVIDDDPAILELVSQYLSLSAQHEVYSEASARDALDVIDKSEAPFDCFLVDIQMPGVDGITLVEFIRERAAYRYAPIIMLTAMEDKDHVDRAFAAGATDYVTKPFDFYDLQIRIHSAQENARLKARDLAEPTSTAGAGPSGGPTGGPSGGPSAPRLADPISLPEIETAIDYAEFENYIRQLVNRRLYRISTIAVKIGGVEQIHAQFTGEEFRALIHDVAEEIRATLMSVGGILSYRGNGIFLCIPDRRLQGRRNAMQKALNRNFKIVHPALGRLPSALLVSDQIPLGNSSDASVLGALALAIESAEKQAHGIGDLLGASKRLLNGEPRIDGAGGWDQGAGEPLM